MRCKKTSHSHAGIYKPDSVSEVITSGQSKIQDYRKAAGLKAFLTYLALNRLTRINSLGFLSKPQLLLHVRVITSDPILNLP